MPSPLTLSPSLVEAMQRLQVLTYQQGVLDWEQTQPSSNQAALAKRETELIARRQSVLRDETVRKDVLHALDGRLNAPERGALEAIQTRAAGVPDEALRRFSELRLASNAAWIEARQRQDFAEYKQALRDVIAIRIELAECTGYSRERYDACIREFEPHLTVSEIAALLKQIEDRTSVLRASALARDWAAWHAPRGLAMQQSFREYLHDLAARLGFDATRGRITSGTHTAVANAGADDVRVTLRLDTFGDPIRSLRDFGHEIGHALYWQGIPAEWAKTPHRSVSSTSLHESQALVWEQHIVRALAFWEAEAPALSGIFKSYRAADAQWFYRVCNRVENTFDMAQVDEVSYSRHLDVRVTLERDLINGDLGLVDLRDRCAELYKQKLDQDKPSDDTIYQEVAWSLGYFGYLPTYVIGRVYAAALVDAMTRELTSDGVGHSIHSRNPGAIRDWLRSKVWTQGNPVDPRLLITQIAGTDPIVDAAAYVAHLEGRYANLP